MAKAADVAPGRACKRAGRALIEAGRGRRRKRRTVPQAVASLSGHVAVRYAAARVRACKPRRERGSQSRAWRTCAYPERGERRGLEPVAGDSAAGSAAAPEKPARRARHRQSSDPKTACVRNTGRQRRRPNQTRASRYAAKRRGPALRASSRAVPQIRTRAARRGSGA